MINLKKTTKELEGINFVAFSNNVVVVNTTPHPVTMQDMDGTLITVPTSVLINAKAEERKVSDLFVRTEFVGTEEGKETIERIKSVFPSPIGELHFSIPSPQPHVLSGTNRGIAGEK